ncbi:YceD family protein [Dyadobacter subterraneus]|uniref:YceD family protein n=1 Tax=Dyadobacter subterraneus TaxID=2773304 RepID=UPI0036D28484
MTEIVKELSKYNIDIYGLEDKQYDYDMESGDAFFQELEQDLIEHGQFKTHVVLTKSATMLQLHFHTEGSVELLCDRTLEPFEEPVISDDRIILKFGDRDEELTDEIEIINRNTNRINVAKYVFEFIALSLPVKKLHPSLRTEDDTDDESEDDEVILVYSSADDEETDENDSEEKIDPRWEALKKLKGQ